MRPFLPKFAGSELTMVDPIEWMSDRYPYDPDRILACTRGSVYTALMLANGQIGVCATPGNPEDTDPVSIFQADLSRTDHRILVNAFYNAHCNCKTDMMKHGDIFELIDFSRTSKHVMIGYFPPLVEKFRKGGIPVSVFDHSKEFPDVFPAGEMSTLVPEAEKIIMTSTTIFNGSFSKILALKNPSSQLYLLGPSTPLDPDFKQEFGIAGLFGMIFEPYDFEVLKIIGQGHGTPSFSAKGKKVSLQE
jgi:hypothetical protein